MKYKDAGVDIDVANRVVKIVGKKAKTTLSRHVLDGVGPFGAMYRLPKAWLKDPVLVSTMDGVGTKLKICSQLGRHDVAGYDIVSHCANDVLAEGARPIFVLDYIAMSVLDPAVVEKVIDGIVKACIENECALIGGETAELPDTYPENEYELVGCMIGIVDGAKMVNGATIAPGDVVVGLGSSGLHTNGYSLARKVLLDLRGYALTDRVAELRATVGDALLAPHKSYVRSVLPLVDRGLIKGIAHITGGGIPGNVSRVLPKGMGVTLRRDAWEVPPIFKVIQREGGVSEDEMYRTFNMGLGLMLIVGPAEADAVVGFLAEAKEEHWKVGEVVEHDAGFRLTG